jgi:V8-like Glu-specific endopeptidase
MGEPSTSDVGTHNLDGERLSLEKERLRTERQKLAIELRLKRRESAERRGKSWKELLANPLTLAIVGGFITVMTTIVTTSYTANENRLAENLRAQLARDSANQALQAELIKKFVEAPKTETVRENLRFLVDAGLLPDYSARITRYLTDNPDAAPAVGNTLVGGVVGDTDQRIVLDNIARADRNRFQGVGLVDVDVGGRRSNCAGFLVAPGIVVTADFCFGSPIDPKATATFKPLPADAGAAASPIDIDIARRVLVRGPSPGDAGVVVVGLQSPDTVGHSFLHLADEPPSEGQPLEMAFSSGDKGWLYSAGANCRAILVETSQLRHLCDTGPGSSGAPLLTAGNKVVGVHMSLDVKYKKAFRADLIRKDPDVQRIFGNLPVQVPGQPDRR